MVECNRCGKCCYHNVGGGRLVKCPMLTIKGDKTTKCKVYKERLNYRFLIEGRIFRCVMYNSLAFEIKGCPLNEGNKPEKDYIIKKKKGQII